MTASVVAPVSQAGGEASPPGPTAEDADMKGVEATPEEQERLATGNNNGSLDTKLPSRPQHTGPRSAFYSTRVFMLVFLSGWVLQGMFLTYFVSVTTTVEKLYKVESKTTGTLLAATEIGQICTALFLTYLAGRGHRPRWIACMMLVLAVGVIGCVVPHVRHGTELLVVLLDGHRSGPAPTCNTYENSSVICDEVHVTNTATRSSITNVMIPWLFICLLIVGVGQTGIATLGIPYVDDNVGSRQSPLYMAITIGIRVIGPALGFLLGALCTRVYVYPLTDPGYDSTDPRWVGAWWLGMVFIASFVVILSALMFFFPKQIKQDPIPLPPKKCQERRDPFFKDFFATIKRQLTNDILMWRTASSVFHLMPISGVYSFLPKYLEKNFRLPTHDANLVSGLGGILVMGLGIITSGVVILKLVPSARQVAAWTAVTAAIYSAGMVVLMFVSCPDKSYRYFGSGIMGESNLECSLGCHCADVAFSPVCGQDRYTYLSPCQAGCLDSLQLDNTTWMYRNCSCIDGTMRGEEAINAIERYSERNFSDKLFTGPNGFAVSGECGGPCDQIYVFIAIFAALMFVHASGEVGAVLLIIRCTDKYDKAMAMGVIQFAIGVFGNVPCPILFGAAVDAACRLRDAACGALGACASYDTDSFRFLYLGLSAGIMFLAFIMDLLVWSKASRIDMNPGEGRPQLPSSSPVSPTSPTTADSAPLHVAPTDTQL
ncbi:hypothetical protein K1T71_002131 [Dendrolimus kikuchii]|uniref:Uncharacterized protein n=1 Tax=Dendrolimus kikuchii TaxID=765133 RepID=A0ACC1DFT9_9NEOP|nr:hypothetical protein K1T71_002131 [Dendrolimus kikuchii]